MRAGAFVFVTLCFVQAAHAGPPELVLPLDCDLGKTCYIEDYVDAQPGEGQADYTCGLKSRDDHRGTDIVLSSFEAMEAGVNVLAAAAGTVAATRDGMADIAVTDETREAIAGRECGNAVRIDHGDGWQTLYCHLKRGSVIVRQGDKVMPGDPLGQVGLSGLTNIPHIHIGVLKDGNVVDPFAPDDTNSCEAPDGPGLWAETPPYTQTGLFTAGFSTSVPGLEAVQTGAARVTRTQSDQPLVLYAHAFYAATGDVLVFTATGPDGEAFADTVTLDNPQVQIMRAYGRKAPAGGWTVGDYRGVVRLERDGTLIAWRHADVTITSQ
jgi:hypothetical protein